MNEKKGFVREERFANIGYVFYRFRLAPLAGLGWVRPVTDDGCTSATCTLYKLCCWRYS